MAIRIIEGVPGSGKTYYAVRHLAKNYFKKEKDGNYTLNKACTLITNIDSFKPDHLSLQDEIKNAGGVQTFFSFDYQQKFKEDKEQIIYIIDEAQRFFRKGTRGLAECFTYFEYHRHWGQDIYLVTQNARKLPPDIVYLTEYIIVAAPRTRSILGEFKYKWISEGEIIKREGFKPDQGVFNLYKSMDLEESEKISNPVMKTVYITLAIVALVVFLGYRYFVTQWSPKKTKNIQSVSSSSSSQSNSTVPIRSSFNTQSPKKVISEYFVFLPLNTITTFIENNSHLTLSIKVPWQGSFYDLQSLPYPTKKIGSKWFLVLRQREFLFLYPDEETRPKNIFMREKPAAMSAET